MVERIATSCCCFLVLLYPYPVCLLQFTEPFNGNKVTGVLGSSLNFTWAFHGGKIDRIAWGTKKGGLSQIKDVLISIDNLQTITAIQNSPYSGRVSGIWNGSSPGQATFTLSSIQKADERFYACRLTPDSLDEPVVHDTVQLLVVVVPQIDKLTVQSSYTEGSAINITCAASGSPDPDVQWIRNGKVKTSGKNTVLLTFSNINRADGGQYTCRANNSLGSAENHTVLVVHYKPEDTTLNFTAADNTVTQGGNVIFTCHVTAAKPQVSRYRFYLNDTTLVKDSNDNQYTINNVQRSQHYGKYKCIPSNDVGDGPEATVILKVNVPVQFTVFPQNVTVNETNPVVLSCDASGFPEPSFTWTKEGQELSQSEQLNIQRSDRSDTGMYVCTASNGVGQDHVTAQAYVTVQYTPSIKEATPSAAKSWIGQTVMLKCVSDGVPTPTLTWYKPNGSQINIVTAAQITVNVKMSVDQDFGDYKCVADNGLTPADFKIVKIEQIKKPGSPTIEPLDIQATSLTVKWTAPDDDGGSPITAYRVVILKGSTEIKNFNITDPGETSRNAGGLVRNTTYTVKVLARNAVFEGPAVEKEVRTKYEGVPEAATIYDLPNEVTDITTTLKWREPQNNGKVITKYTVYQRIVTDDKPGEWIELKTITDVSVRELKVKLESGKVYEFVVTATNLFGESLKEEEKVKRVKASENLTGGGGTQTGDGDDGNGMGAAIYAGVAAAGVLLIIGIIVIIVLWRRRKPSSDEDTSRDELGSANPYESEDGYHSVSREAAQSLQASGPAAEPNYALVDQSRKKKNRMPANDEYAQVNKSKITKKKKKKPGELDYADLEDLRADIQLGPVPSGGAAAAAPIFRPPAYEGTEYADISQFGVPQPDPTYANVPKQEVVYSNVESM